MGTAQLPFPPGKETEKVTGSVVARNQLSKGGLVSKSRFMFLVSKLDSVLLMISNLSPNHILLLFLQSKCLQPTRAALLARAVKHPHGPAQDQAGQPRPDSAK